MCYSFGCDRMVQIYRKNSLARAMTRMQRISGVYSFAPRTWLLPFDLKEVEKFLARGGNKSNRCVIVKPAAGAQVTATSVSLEVGEPVEQLIVHKARQPLKRILVPVISC